MTTKRCKECFKIFHKRTNEKPGRFGSRKFCSRRCAVINRVQTHGMTGTNFFKVFMTIKQRCNNPKNPRYKYYGGRGIKCLWNSFEEFRDDMFPNYKKGLEIDRTNNDGNYCKENCKWVSHKQQCNNYRRNRLVSFKGITKNLKQWSEDLNIGYGKLQQRLNAGWDFETAITSPTRINQYR